MLKAHCSAPLIQLFATPIPPFNMYISINISMLFSFYNAGSAGGGKRETAFWIMEENCTWIISIWVVIATKCTYYISSDLEWRNIKDIHSICIFWIKTGIYEWHTVRILIFFEFWGFFCFPSWAQTHWFCFSTNRKRRIRSSLLKEISITPSQGNLHMF